MICTQCGDIFLLRFCLVLNLWFPNGLCMNYAIYAFTPWKMRLLFVQFSYFVWLLRGVVKPNKYAVPAKSTHTTQRVNKTKGEWSFSDIKTIPQHRKMKMRFGFVGVYLWVMHTDFPFEFSYAAKILYVSMEITYIKSVRHINLHSERIYSTFVADAERKLIRFCLPACQWIESDALCYE